MIGLGTRILLRLRLNDEPAQNKRIDALLTEYSGTPGSLLVTDVVLAEPYGPCARRSTRTRPRSCSRAAAC